LVRTEGLHHLDLGVNDSAEALATRHRKVLRPDPDNDPPPAVAFETRPPKMQGAWQLEVLCPRVRLARSLDSAPSKRFMAGEPMKPATKVFVWRW